MAGDARSGTEVHDAAGTEAGNGSRALDRARFRLPRLRRPAWPGRLGRLSGLDRFGGIRGIGRLGEPGDGQLRWQRWKPRLRLATFALAGAALAVALAGRVSARLGPFDATIAARPSLGSQTTVRLAPLGTIVLDTHDWPVALDLRVDQIGLTEAERIAENPQLVDQLGDDVADDVNDALTELAWRCAVVAVLGGALGALAARAHWRSSLRGAVAGVTLVGLLGGGTAVTFDPNAVAEPRYTGLLRAAPAAVGDVEAIVERYGEYRAQLSDLVGNVVTLYLAAENLPTFEPGDDTIRVLHVSDIHLNVQAFDVVDQVTDQFDIDAVVDTGDITDWGSEPETRLLDEIGRLEVPYVWVKGNHDSTRTGLAVAAQPNAVVLDGDAATVAGLRFWGIGDPRYTPNKDQPEDAESGSEQEQAVAFAPEVARAFADDTPPGNGLCPSEDGDGGNGGNGDSDGGNGDSDSDGDGGNGDEDGGGEPLPPECDQAAAQDTAEGQEPVDVVLVHDSRIAGELGGKVPLVLAGHTHDADTTTIEPVDPADQDGDGADDGDGGEESTDGGNGETGSGGDVDPTVTTDPDAPGREGDAGGDAGDGDGEDEATEFAPLVETLLFTEGSTGGAGLRGLQGEEPHPLSATVLYFDEDTHRLVAYDRITVKGFGETGATIERHILEPPDPAK